MFRAYYQDVRTFEKAAYSSDPHKRMVYDLIYRFVKGTYELQPVTEK